MVKFEHTIEKNNANIVKRIDEAFQVQETTPIFQKTNIKIDKKILSSCWMQHNGLTVFESPLQVFPNKQ